MGDVTCEGKKKNQMWSGTYEKKWDSGILKYLLINANKYWEEKMIYKKD